MGAAAQAAVLPAALAEYSISWSGQFEYLERAPARLKVVVPATLVIIFVLLYMIFQRFDEALLIMATLPFALAETRLGCPRCQRTDHYRGLDGCH